MGFGKLTFVMIMLIMICGLREVRPTSYSVHGVGLLLILLVMSGY